MAPRLAARPARENDFSNVGKVGRRTGVTLPQGRLDVNGMEEITGIFSSPRKPSPLRKSMSVMESVEMESVAEISKEMTRLENTGKTPSQALSARKSILPPRSASPRKSGINGLARRSNAVDVFNQNRDANAVNDQDTNAIDNQNVEELRSVVTPTLSATGARRFSPEKTPLKSVLRSRPRTAKSTKKDSTPLVNVVQPSIETPKEPIEVHEVHEETETSIRPSSDEDLTDAYDLPAVADDDVDRASSAATSDEEELDDPPLPPPFDDEEADRTFEPEPRSKPKSREPTIANSRRKRKSDALEQQVEAEAISSPAAKRAKRISDQSTNNKPKAKSPTVTQSQSTAPRPRGRPPLKKKDNNVKLSARQEEELDNIVEKVKTRPGQKKSLYILRRETPAEDSITHTRSGRISVKPLAYWKNERCVYGGSPGGANLQDGARFPMNSIKEIIRAKDMSEEPSKKAKRSTKGKGKGRATSENPTAGAGTDEEDDSDQELDESYVDPDAESWEVERGIYKGPVAVWDAQDQTPTEEEKDMDIAYAPASIETREVKGSTFRYAKLLSLKFFGSGIVDLPPGSVKKTKNSQRMHMSFFVATGRVTVQVGALDGTQNRFSVGKGGWWQVPRGNQYSMENEHQKPARVFFSQACEPLVYGDDE